MATYDKITNYRKIAKKPLPKWIEVFLLFLYRKKKKF
jgi:hypothetical protein